MSKPNKTVGNWRKKVGFAPRPPKPTDAFVEWMCANPTRSAEFVTVEKARDAFEAEQKATGATLKEKNT
jgi:hypothetical protein